MGGIIGSLLHPFLVFLGALVLAVLVVLVAVGVRRRQAGRRWFALFVVAHAMLLLFVMVRWVNGAPGYFEENTKAVHLWASLKELRHGPPDPIDQGVDLVLIDQSRSKMVVDANGRVNAEGGVPLTDRAQLAALLNLLADHQDSIAFVVCDIIFDMHSEQDSALAAAMQRLVGAQKIFLAHGDVDNVEPLRFGAGIMGSVTVGTQEGKVVRQSLMNEAGHPTLPYLMHARYHGLTCRPSPWGYFLVEEGAGTSAHAYPDFIPFVDRLSESSYALPPTLVGGGSRAVPPLMPLELRHAVKAAPMLLLPRLNTARSAKGPIVFVGEFLGAPELGGTDVHRTFRGEMHGSTILLNQFLELGTGAHRFTPWPLVWQGALLIVASIILLHRIWWPKQAPAKLDAKDADAPATTAAPPVTADRIFPAATKAITKKLTSALPGLLIGVAFGIIGWCFRQPANIGALTLYFLTLNALVRSQASAKS